VIKSGDSIRRKRTKRLGTLCLVLILMISAFSVMTGYTSGNGEELLEESDDIGYDLVEPGHGTDVDIYHERETNLSVTVDHEDAQTLNVTFYGRAADEDDFEEIYENTSVESGDYANMTWKGLEFGTEYTWYVNVTEDTTHGDYEDPQLYNVSEEWTFTTADSPIKITMNEPGDGADLELYPDTETNLSVTVDNDEEVDMNVTFYAREVGEDVFEWIGENNSVAWDGDGYANVTWELDYDTEYEWYVHVYEDATDDGNEDVYNESATRTFSTDEIITERTPEHEAEDVQLDPELNVTVEHPNGADLNVTFYEVIDEDSEELYNETVESGEYVTYIWEDLDFNTTYEWYVVVEENQTDEHLTESEVWNFTTEKAPEMYNLTLGIDGNGAITVEWNEEEENVTDDDTLEIRENTTVTLTADPDEGHKFVEWTGNVSSTEEVITITMDEDKEITASFEEVDQPYFEVEITEYDEEIEVGRYIMVEYTVKNTGDVEGTQDIEFLVEGSLEDIEDDVTLEPGENRTGKFFWEAEVGSHLLTVQSEDDRDRVSVYVYMEEPDLLPGFTSILLILATVFAAVVYHKKKR